jgi:hypothetical protein
LHLVPIHVSVVWRHAEDLEIQNRCDSSRDHQVFTHVSLKITRAETSPTICSSLATPDSETTENNLVFVGHGIQNDLQRLEEMKISKYRLEYRLAVTHRDSEIPNNVLVIDTSIYERQLFASGARGQMMDGKSGSPREPGSTLSLGNMLRSLGVDLRATLHNAGNDAFLALLALQIFVDPKHTAVPPTAGVMVRAPAPNIQIPTATGGGMAANMYSVVPSPSMPVFNPGLAMASSTPSPSGLAAGGYFDTRRSWHSPGLAVPGSMGTSRNSRRLSALVPDEMGNLNTAAQSQSTDRLSKSMRDLSMG